MTRRSARQRATRAGTDHVQPVQPQRRHLRGNACIHADGRRQRQRHVQHDEHDVRRECRGHLALAGRLQRRQQQRARHLCLWRGTVHDRKQLDGVTKLEAARGGPRGRLSRSCAGPGGAGLHAITSSGVIMTSTPNSEHHVAEGGSAVCGSKVRCRCGGCPLADRRATARDVLHHLTSALRAAGRARPPPVIPRLGANYAATRPRIGRRISHHASPCTNSPRSAPPRLRSPLAFPPPDCRQTSGAARSSMAAPTLRGGARGRVPQVPQVQRAAEDRAGARVAARPDDDRAALSRARHLRESSAWTRIFGGIAKSRTGRRPAAFGGRRSLTWRSHRNTKLPCARRGSAPGPRGIGLRKLDRSRVSCEPGLRRTSQDWSVPLGLIYGNHGKTDWAVGR